MRKSLLFLIAFALSACSNMVPEAPPASDGHLSDADATPADTASIPDVVSSVPFVPEPEAVPKADTYSVVVNNVPVKEILFALARDAKLNIDVHPDINGLVTLNAVDQSLEQILERLARQVNLRYGMDNGTLVIAPDAPFLRTYDVGYVNLSRDVDSRVNVATQVATTGEGATQGSGGGGGGGAGGGAAGGAGNASNTQLRTRSYNRFWQTLTENVMSILNDEVRDQNADRLGNENVVINAEAGLMTVRATSQQHNQIQAYVDKVLRNVRRQVMVEATIVEVTLNDQYQAGVDWNVLLDPDQSGFGLRQDLLGAVTDGVIGENISSFVFGYSDPNNNGRQIDLTLRLLDEFGDTKVMSSPRLMVLNNQTAVLKVVEELVYFTVEVTDRDATLNSQGRIVVESEVHSVPVGLVMTVTPQISENDEVTLTVRPTISQKIGDAIDPGPQIAAQFSNNNSAQSNITNLVPVIRVRELESVLKVVDGQIAVLGGLMQDQVQTANRSVPGLSRLPVIGEMFFDTDESVTRKTELVIFLRPVVVEQPDVNEDLEEYKPYLQGAL